MRKPTIKQLKKIADTLFSKYIRARDHNTCVLCGSTERPQCGHLLSRSASATRWDETQCFCQCSSCNFKHEFNAYPFIKWFIEKYGKEKLDEIQSRWNKPFQMHRGDYEILILSIEEKLKCLNLAS